VEFTKVYGNYGVESLGLQVKAQIGFVHGRHGVTTHGGMSVNTVNFAAFRGRCVKLTEGTVPTQAGLATDHHSHWTMAWAAQCRQASSQVSDVRRAVKGGAALVMRDFGIQRREQVSDGLQFSPYLIRGQSPGNASYAKRIQGSGAFNLRGSRHLGE